MPLSKRALAEFIGTFWLVFGGCGSAVLAAAFPALGIGFVGVALVWVWQMRSRKERLSNAQFRWRHARYCARCDAVYVTGETLYTSPRHVEDVLWNTPSQFA